MWIADKFIMTFVPTMLIVSSILLLVATIACLGSVANLVAEMFPSFEIPWYEKRRVREAQKAARERNLHWKLAHKQAKKDASWIVKAMKNIQGRSN